MDYLFAGLFILLVGLLLGLVAGCERLRLRGSTIKNALDQRPDSATVADAQQSGSR